VTNYFLPLLRCVGFNERRKMANFLLVPALQLKLPLYTLLLSATFGALALLVGYIYFGPLYAAIIENATMGDHLREAVTRQAGKFIEASAMLVIGYVLLMVSFTMVYTHRILGPTAAMTRHIRALKNGFYSHRISLRSRDELQELANELNELAETLETYEHRETDDS